MTASPPRRFALPFLSSAKGKGITVSMVLTLGRAGYDRWVYCDCPLCSLAAILGPTSRPYGCAAKSYPPATLPRGTGSALPARAMTSSPRTLFGTRAAWQVVLMATLMSVLIGVPLGMVSGYLGGKLDKLLLFFMDTIYTLPGLLLSVNPGLCGRAGGAECRCGPQHCLHSPVLPSGAGTIPSALRLSYSLRLPRRWEPLPGLYCPATCF